jgi:hypothetical protein
LSKLPIKLGPCKLNGGIITRKVTNGAELGPIFNGYSLESRFRDHFRIFLKVDKLEANNVVWLQKSTADIVLDTGTPIGVGPKA